MRAAHIYPALRQWIYPPEFQISVAGKQDAVETLANLLVQAIAAQAQVQTQVQAQAANLLEKMSVTPSIPPALACSLANYYFRLQRNAQQMAIEGAESKELRSIKRALEDMTDTLHEHGVECIDLTGQDYDPGRVDFEQFGAPEVKAGLVREKIGRCEKPAVLLNGKLLQKAKGLVARPA